MGNWGENAPTYPHPNWRPTGNSGFYGHSLLPLLPLSPKSVFCSAYAKVRRAAMTLGATRRLLCSQGYMYAQSRAISPSFYRVQSSSSGNKWGKEASRRSSVRLSSVLPSFRPSVRRPIKSLSRRQTPLPLFLRSFLPHFLFGCSIHSGGPRRD